MNLIKALSILNHMRYVLSVGLPPTLKAVLASPSLLLRPRDLSRVYMAALWGVMGDREDETQAKLITPNAYGIVVDLGAGHGHGVRYLDKARVTLYIAVEPNTLMHPFIRAHADKAGYHEADGSLIILGCGVEDINTILQALQQISPRAGAPVQIDTVISIRTLCSVPNAQHAMENLIQDAVKPGGQLLMYEHVLNKREDVAWWQRFWTPLWSVCFDGCRLDQCTDVWIRDLKMRMNIDGVTERVSAWRDSEMWDHEECEEEDMLWHVFGRFVRA